MLKKFSKIWPEKNFYILLRKIYNLKKISQKYVTNCTQAVKFWVLEMLLVLMTSRLEALLWTFSLHFSAWTRLLIPYRVSLVSKSVTNLICNELKVSCNYENVPEGSIRLINIKFLTRWHLFSNICSAFPEPIFSLFLLRTMFCFYLTPQNKLSVASKVTQPLGIISS